LSLGPLDLLLSGPGASGSRPIAGGQHQQPGGWNRVVLQVSDLPEFIEQLRGAGLKFRNDMEVGPHGKQVQVEDPDGNSIELFEPAK
jgi:glyoxylase I family protein